MAIRTLTVNSVVLQDPESGAYKQFFEGEEFDTETDKKWISQLGDHCFAERLDAEPELGDLTKQTVAQLVDICRSLDIEPRSNKKSDLIEQIEEFYDNADDD